MQAVFNTTTCHWRICSCARSDLQRVCEISELLFSLDGFFCSCWTGAEFSKSTCVESTLSALLEALAPRAEGVALMIFESGMHFDFEKAKARQHTPDISYFL